MKAEKGYGNFQRLRLKDIAAAAGVSKSTVSRALKADRRIRGCVRQRVEAAADRMGYRPDPMARAFLRRTSGLVGAYSHADFPGVLLAQALRTVAEELVHAGYATVLTFDEEAHGDAASPRCSRAIRERYIEALICFENIPLHIRREIRELKLPTVVAMGLPVRDRDATVIAMDLAATARLMVRHLMERGHRRIAGVYFGTVPALEPLGVEFLDCFNPSYSAAVSENGLPATRIDARLADPDAWLDAAFRQMPDVTAIMVMDMDTWRQLKPALKRRGCLVPQDVSIISFSSSGFCLQNRSVCTTIEMGIEQIGRLVAREIAARLADPASPDGDQLVLVPPTDIVDLGTTAAVRKAGVSRNAQDGQPAPQGSKTGATRRKGGLLSDRSRSKGRRTFSGKSVSGRQKETGEVR